MAKFTEMSATVKLGLVVGLLLAFAYPERIAKARGGQGEFQLVGGRGAFLEPTDALAREPWLAVAKLGGGATIGSRHPRAAGLDSVRPC